MREHLQQPNLVRTLVRMVMELAMVILELSRISGMKKEACVEDV